MANQTLAQPPNHCQLAEHSILQHDNTDEHNLNHKNKPLSTSEFPEHRARAKQPEDSTSVTWLSLPHKSQLLILALCRLSEPLSNTCLLPYLYQLVRSLQSSSDRGTSAISRQAGLLVAIFALAQLFTSLPWAYHADRCGRKSAIILGLVMSIISNVGFGFSKTIPAVMCWRLLGGIGNGNIGVMRTMTAEIVKEKKYQSRAFLLLPLVFNSGNIIGLAIGGWLADPVANMPLLFGPQGLLNISSSPEGVVWLKRFPFALPTLWNAAVLTVSFALAVGNLKETLPGKTGEVVPSWIRWSLHRFTLPHKSIAYTLINQSQTEIEESEDLVMPVTVPRKSIRRKISSVCRDICTEKIIWTNFTIFIFHLHNSAFIQAFPVYLATPSSDRQRAEKPSLNVIYNGLGLAPATIGLFLSSTAIIGILVQMFSYPTLQARLGTLGIYQVGLIMMPLIYLIIPYINLIPEYPKWWQMSGIAVVLLSHVTARTFAIPSSVILLTNSAHRPALLGMIHGLGNMMNCLSRAIGPGLGGIFYGWSVLMFWLGMFCLAMVGLFVGQVCLKEEEEY